MTSILTQQLKLIRPVLRSSRRTLTTDTHLPPHSHSATTGSKPQPSSSNSNASSKRLPSVHDPHPRTANHTGRPGGVAMAHPLDPHPNRNNPPPSKAPKGDPGVGPSSSKLPEATLENEPPAEPPAQEASPNSPPSTDMIPFRSSTAATGTTTPSSSTGHPHSYYSNPPFHTHAFFSVLEKTFPTPTARSLMRATRALLVDRMARVHREGLTIKDLDNQAYLFRAALQEMRAEINASFRNATGEAKNKLAELSKEVDKLGVEMREGIDGLKHEIQMEVDSRKNETRSELKRQDILIEEVLNKAIVSISDLRTQVEENKWENMRRAVVALFSFVGVIVIFMELRPKPHAVIVSPPPPKQLDTKPLQPDSPAETEKWVT